MFGKQRENYSEEYEDEDYSNPLKTNVPIISKPVN